MLKVQAGASSGVPGWSEEFGSKAAGFPGTCACPACAECEGRALAHAGNTLCLCPEAAGVALPRVSWRPPGQSPWFPKTPLPPLLSTVLTPTGVPAAAQLRRAVPSRSLRVAWGRPSYCAQSQPLASP